MRFFVDNVTGASFEMTGAEFNHLAYALRARVGDEVVLCEGDAIEHFGVITSIQKERAIIKITSSKKSETEAQIELTLFQAAAKNDKLELIAQKLTELGAMKMCVFNSSFCNALGNLRLDRLNKISVEAAKQCGRARAMSFEGCIDFSDMLARIKSGYDMVIFANEREKNVNAGQLIGTDLKNKRVAIIIGSEGGFSEQEAQEIIQQGAISVSLGRRILRLETAAISLAALLLIGN